jgi:hypothetical protein
MDENALAAEIFGHGSRTDRTAHEAVEDENGRAVGCVRPERIGSALLRNIISRLKRHRRSEYSGKKRR